MRVEPSQFAKKADAPTNALVLSGRLEASKSGWILLSVPNAIVQGLFAALDVPGAELPPSGPDGKLNAHISVIRGDELESLGGAEKITERGKRFKFQLGPMQECTPKGWGEMSKVWFVKCVSKELEALRRSYGLSSLPKNNQYEFHLTVAVRRKNVLRNGEVTKQSAVTSAGRFFTREELLEHGKCVHGVNGECEACRKENCPHCGATQERGDDGSCNRCGKPWPEDARGKLLSEITREKLKKPAQSDADADIKSAEAYDIPALLARLSGRRPELVPVADLQVGSRSKRDRFGPKRYENADQYDPVILHRQGGIVDGRHRVAKLQDRGGQNILAHLVDGNDLRGLKLSAVQTLELEGWQKEAAEIVATVEALLPQLPQLAKVADAGYDIYWLPTSNEFVAADDRPGPNWIPLTDLHISKAANWKTMPMSQMLGGSLVGGALGYGGGAMLEKLFPERFIERGKLRRTLGMGGLMLGALPGAWAWGANVSNARAGGQMQGAGGAMKGLVTPTESIPLPDVVFPGQYLDETPAPRTPKIAQVMRELVEQKLVVNNELLPGRLEAVKLASLDFGGGGLQSIPVDAFNNAIWNDVRKGMSAAQNPYGTKSPWGSNDQELHTPPQIGAATAGIVGGIQAMYGGTSVLSPRHLVNGLLAAGADLATANVVGSTLGALGGLTPAAQDTLQNMGLWGGLLRGTVGSMLGVR